MLVQPILQSEGDFIAAYERLCRELEAALSAIHSWTDPDTSQMTDSFYLLTKWTTLVSTERGTRRKKCELQHYSKYAIYNTGKTQLSFYLALLCSQYKHGHKVPCANLLIWDMRSILLVQHLADNAIQVAEITGGVWRSVHSSRSSLFLSKTLPHNLQDCAV